MLLEVHFTLAAASHLDRVALAARADALGMKLTHIELPHGACTSQLMVTARVAATGGDVMAPLDALRSKLIAATGLRVLRTKLESFLGDEPPPSSGMHTRYLEQHLKVRLTPAALELISTLAAEHGAHLSRNAFSRSDDGTTTRFLTQRFAADAEAASTAALERLRHALLEQSIAALKVERERVLYDDNIALDGGWSGGSSP